MAETISMESCRNPTGVIRMTTAIVCIKGDYSVGIADQCYQIADLDLDGEEHRDETVKALKNCFSIITGESQSYITVNFDDEYAAEWEAEQADERMIQAYWKEEDLTNTYLNEQRN
jgi:hypothetical protein